MEVITQDEILGTGADSPDHSQTHRRSIQLPEKPVARIRPRQSWVALDLGGLWAYRELFYFLIWRDVKVRYKQTVLGVAWAILQPVVMIVIFSLIFGRVAGIPSDGIPYALFAYAGVVTWTFFSSAVPKTGNSLVSSAPLIPKVYFPPLTFPPAALCP